MMNTTTPNVQIDLLLEKIIFHSSAKSPQHVLLSDIPEGMITLAELFFKDKEFVKGCNVLEELTEWIHKDLNYFIAMEGKNRKMYDWDIVTGLQMFDKLIRLLQTYSQQSLADKLLKDYARMNIDYARNGYQMRMIA